MFFQNQANPSVKIIQIYCFVEMIGELTTDDLKLVKLSDQNLTFCILFAAKLH